MDADFSHDPADLARLLAAAEDADVVLGSRYVAGGGVTDWGLVRRLVSRGGSWYARKVLGLDVRDLTGGFKCFRREVLEAIDLPTVRSRGYAFQVELTHRAVHAGFRVVELPIVFRDRQLGRSKMSWRIAGEAALLVPQLRFAASHIRPAPRSLSARAGARADARSVQTSDLVLVRGLADTRATLDAWNSGPVRSSAAGSSGRSRSRSLLLSPSGSSRDVDPPTRAPSFLGPRRPPALGAGRCTSSAATRSCWRCTRRLRRRLHRRQLAAAGGRAHSGVVAPDPRQGGPAGDRVRRRARRRSRS